MSISDLNQVAYYIGVTKPDNWKLKIYNGSTSAIVTTNLFQMELQELFRQTH